MVARVIVHVGLPKTATSYLQTIIWSNRDALRGAGLVVPGSERRDHLWSSREIREDPNLRRAPERHRTAWRRVLEELASSPGTGLISHEFFAAASGAQAQRMVADLGDVPVSVVVTAREPLGLFTASWQESLKNGSTTQMADYARSESDKSTAIWNWRTLDLRLVLERWSQAIPPARTLVLVLDPTADRADVWRRFAAHAGVDPGVCDLSRSFPNESMGVAEAETLRRINGELEGFGRAFDRGVYIRSFLADQRLAPRRGEKFWPEPAQIEDCRVRGRRTVEYLRRSGHQVSGSLADLLVPEEMEERRTPGSVTDSEVAEVAVALGATMLGDVRSLRKELAQARRSRPAGVRRTALGRLGAVGRRLLRRAVGGSG